MKYTHIFWDWNGTLLDDVNACIDSMNHLLSKRGMKSIDENFYKSVFGFPVVNYYKKLGFDLSIESFEELSVEFISEYTVRSKSVTLQRHASEALIHFRENKISQIVISAMEQEMLFKQIEEQAISYFFADIIGLKDIYAHSKYHLAKKYVEENDLNPSRILFVGDTLHDAEVANQLGCQLILVSNGHHSEERLKQNGRRVINNLEDLIYFAQFKTN